MGHTAPSHILRKTEAVELCKSQHIRVTDWAWELVRPLLRAHESSPSQRDAGSGKVRTHTRTCPSSYMWGRKAPPPSVPQPLQQDMKQALY